MCGAAEQGVGRRVNENTGTAGKDPDVAISVVGPKGGGASLVRDPGALQAPGRRALWVGHDSHRARKNRGHGEEQNGEGRGRENKSHILGGPECREGVEPPFGLEGGGSSQFEPNFGCFVII